MAPRRSRAGASLCRWRHHLAPVVAFAAAGWLTGTVAAAVTSRDEVLRVPPRQEVAVLGRGVVWVDDTHVVFMSFRAGTRTLGNLGAETLPRHDGLASSASAVAVLSDERLLMAIPPRALSAIPQPKPISGGECREWVPGVGADGDFTVVGDTLVAAGECLEPGSMGDVVGEQEAATRQPLFVRGARGGHWRVLRWFPGHDPLILAAEGGLLAVGVQVSLAQMHVTIIDMRSGRSDARFAAPDGDLSFASGKRLVLAVPAEFSPEESDFPLGPEVGTDRDTRDPRSYRLELYSMRGRRVAELGPSVALPSVSHMHVLTDEQAPDGQVLTVSDLSGGPSRRLIGFDDPARSLLALAFRWPAAVVDETTSSPLAQSEVSCWGGEYGPVSAPFLTTFDLARREPFLAAPPSADLVRPPRSTCGSAPPRVHQALGQAAAPRLPPKGSHRRYPQPLSVAKRS
jgi:hypothetical protein